MTVTSTDKNGDNIFWNDNEKQWEYESGKMWVNDKEICERCNKPRLDINGVVDCDFCDYACCGHGDDEQAYISLKDGRRFVLDKIGDAND